MTDITPNEEIRQIEQSTSSIQEIVANTIYELKQKFGETRITADTVHILLKEVIELVEHYSCPGSEKREHVVTIVKALVNDLVDDNEEKRIILEMIDKKILENTVDLIILATKGQLNINNKQTQTKVVSCVKSCFSILVDTTMHVVNSINAARTKRQIKSQAKKQTKKEKTDNKVIARPAEVIVNEDIGAGTGKENKIKSK